MSISDPDPDHPHPDPDLDRGHLLAARAKDRIAGGCLLAVAAWLGLRG